MRTCTCRQKFAKGEYEESAVQRSAAETLSHRLSFSHHSELMSLAMH